MNWDRNLRTIVESFNTITVLYLLFSTFHDESKDTFDSIYTVVMFQMTG